MAFYITRCPDCKSSFNASAAQLKSGTGRVRCGACLKVFDAVENLVQGPASSADEGDGESVYLGSEPDSYLDPTNFLSRNALRSDDGVVKEQAAAVADASQIDGANNTASVAQRADAEPAFELETLEDSFEQTFSLAESAVAGDAVRDQGSELGPAGTIANSDDGAELLSSETSHSLSEDDFSFPLVGEQDPLWFEIVDAHNPLSANDSSKGDSSSAVTGNATGLTAVDAAAAEAAPASNAANAEGPAGKKEHLAPEGANSSTVMTSSPPSPSPRPENFRMYMSFTMVHRPVPAPGPVPGPGPADSTTSEGPVTAPSEGIGDASVDDVQAESARPEPILKESEQEESAVQAQLDTPTSTTEHAAQTILPASPAAPAPSGPSVSAEPATSSDTPDTAIAEQHPAVERANQADTDEADSRVAEPTVAADFASPIPDPSPRRESMPPQADQADDVASSAQASTTDKTSALVSATAPAEPREEDALESAPVAQAAAPNSVSATQAGSDSQPAMPSPLGTEGEPETSAPDTPEHELPGVVAEGLTNYEFEILASPFDDGASDTVAEGDETPPWEPDLEIEFEIDNIELLPESATPPAEKSGDAIDTDAEKPAAESPRISPAKGVGLQSSPAQASRPDPASTPTGTSTAEGKQLEPARKTRPQAEQQHSDGVQDKTSDEAEEVATDRTSTSGAKADSSALKVASIRDSQPEKVAAGKDENAATRSTAQELSVPANRAGKQRRKPEREQRKRKADKSPPVKAPEDTSEAIRARALRTRLEDERALHSIPEENIAALKKFDSPLRLATGGRRDLRSTLTYGGLSLLLSAMFLAQLLYREMAVYSQNASIRPLYELACAVLPCTVPDYSEVAAIYSERVDVRSHPTRANGLLVTMSFRNAAAFPQPFPVLILSFNSNGNELVAVREFGPNEYLDPDLRDIEFMPVMSPVQVSLEIVDPGPDALNYTVAFRAP